MPVTVGQVTDEVEEWLKTDEAIAVHNVGDEDRHNFAVQVVEYLRDQSERHKEMAVGLCSHPGNLADDGLGNVFSAESLFLKACEHARSWAKEQNAK